LEDIVKKIIVIHTGGTISMGENSETGTVSPQKDHPLNDYSNLYFKDYMVETINLLSLPSPHITLKHMLKIKEVIEQKKLEGFNGAVITHGTDTLEETAYFLDLTVDTKEFPVVVTGAMRSSNEVGSDALYNLLSSIRVSSSKDARDRGVLVVMNDEIHSAKGVTKTHTSNIATFQSPRFGAIGIITKKEILFHGMKLASECFSITDISKNVLLIKAYADMDNGFFSCIVNNNYDGVVIEALGQGNLPPNSLPYLKEILDKGIPIVLVSRCFNGIVQDLYDYEGGGKQLKEMGVIFSNGLSGHKARLKLLVLLEQGLNYKILEEQFKRNY
jgi:L-asparaginase